MRFSDGKVSEEICGKMGFENPYTVNVLLPSGSLKHIEIRIDEDAQTVTGMRFKSEIDSREALCNLEDADEGKWTSVEVPAYKSIIGIYGQSYNNWYNRIRCIGFIVGAGSLM